MKLRSLKWRFYRKTGGPRELGHRCKDFCGGCIVCESYRYLDQHGGFPSFEEAADICDVVHGNPRRYRTAAGDAEQAISPQLTQQ